MRPSSLPTSLPTVDPERAVPRVLCQPEPGKSCGSCCGMYNHRDAADEADVLGRLLARTRAFRQDTDIQDTASLRAFREAWHVPEAERLLDGLPTCPFLGLLDVREAAPEADEGDEEALAVARASRVGCLVHPLQHGGLDQRDCGVYDRHICEDYLCAAHTLMTEDERWLVLSAVQDSYLYGLVVTDVRFVRALLEHAAAINGMAPPRRLLRTAGAVAAARAYFALKRGWPYRAFDGIFGQVIPETGLDTRRRPGPSEALGLEPDPYEAIFLCLGTGEVTLAEMEHARRLVAARVHDFANAVAL